MVDKTTFFTWCATKRKLAKSSMKHTRIRYDVLIRWLAEKPLSVETAQGFISYLIEAGKANATINSYIRVINLIDIYERDHTTDLNLMKDISYMDKIRRSPTIFTEHEVDRILSATVTYQNRAIKGSQLNLIYHLVTYIIFSTGCRLEESLGLLVDDIIIGEESYVNIKNNKYRTIKNKLERQTPIPNYPLLSEFLKGRNGGELAFTTSRGNKIPAQCMERDWALRLKSARILKKAHIHDVRNSYIMEHIRNNTQLLYISNLVGHKDPKTTLWYTAFNQKELQLAASNHHLYKAQLSPEKKLIKVREKLEKVRLEIEHDIDFELPIFEPTEKRIKLIITLK